MNFLGPLEDHLNFFYCTGINYKSSDIDVRESVSLDEGKRNFLYQKLKEKGVFSEALILSTCNRLEVYGVFNPTQLSFEETHEAIWRCILEATDHCKNYFTSKVLPKTYRYRGKEALHHIFKVVCSLDSLCLGETQITGQFKKAYQESRKAHMARFLLGRLNREALTLNRKIRNRTSLGKKNRSMSHLAIDLALHIFQSLEHKNFALIGAGKMIGLAYEYALEHKPESIAIINRTKERAAELARPGTNTFTGGFEHFEQALLQSDIVVSSTGSETFILDYKALRKVQQLRKNRALFIIDIALPRDIDPRCAEVENVYLFDLDDIRKVVKIENHQYEEDLAIADELLEERMEIFETWLEKVESSKNLNNFGGYLQDLFSREAARTLKKRDFQNLSINQKKSIEVMLQSISQKILSDTALTLKESHSFKSDRVEIKLRKNYLEDRGQKQGNG